MYTGKTCNQNSSCYSFRTPIHLAALNGHVETAVAMLEEGCPLDIVDSAGATLLHFAAAGGNL